MDLVLTADAAAFRADVRAFLAENLTPKLRNAHALTANMLDDSETSKDWHARLHARGWAAPAWPKEHGGPGWSPAQKYIFVADLQNGTVWQLDRQSGDIIGRISHKGTKPGEFFRAHVAAMDSKSNSYVGEIGDGSRVQKFSPN